MMQNLALALFLIACSSSSIDAIRVNAGKSARFSRQIARGRADPIMPQLGTYPCTFECGQENVSLFWNQLNDSTNVSSQMIEEFEVGQGAAIVYKAAPDQCLSNCWPYDVTKGTPCDDAENPMNRVKVSKSKAYKLCCVPQQCDYSPTKLAFEPKERADRVPDGLRPFTPLEPMPNKYLDPHTCLCCNVAAVNMTLNASMADKRLKEHCMSPFKMTVVTVEGTAMVDWVHMSNGKEVTSPSLFGYQHLQMQCQDQCQYYKGYPLGKMSPSKRIKMKVPKEAKREMKKEAKAKKQ